MSTDIALNELVAEELYERAAACYVDLLDKRSRPPKITEVMRVLCSEHPDVYPKEHEQHFLAKLHNPAFDAFLEKYRGEYIQRQLAPKLLAAHMGTKIGAKALEQLIDRLDSGDEIKTKDLVALVQLGFGLAEKVGQEVSKQTGNQTQVNFVFQDLLGRVTPDMAEAMTAEMIRINRKKAAEIIDG